MKCWICGKEMKNTIGGCYHCNDCGVGVDDLVFRTSKSDKPTEENFYQQGWVCPKCGGVYSPTQSYCPHCTPPSKLDVTYVTGTGVYNPNMNQSISIIDTGSTKVSTNIAQANPNSNIKVTG